MLVGFCILNKEKKNSRGQFFPEEVNVIQKVIGDNIIYLYGYGPSFKGPVKEGVYKLYEGGLDHRNIHVHIALDYVEIKSDWLGSFPCYYDEISNEITSHWTMLDLENRENDIVASYILKKYSFIPTSRTLKKGIKRLLGGQRIIWRPNYIECVTDKVKLNLKLNSTAEDVVELVQRRLLIDGLDKSEIVLPLSGGYDSRFIASIAKNEMGYSFLACTYSLLGSRGDCFESQVSKIVAQRLDSKRISFDLTGYSKYEGSIIDWSGGFSHVNGDYYEMFAEKLKALMKVEVSKNLLVLSGIVGDMWCGKLKINYFEGVDVKNFLLTHGVRVYNWMYSEAEKNVALEAEKELSQHFSQRVSSKDEALLEIVRAKIGLLSFLCYSFEKRGIRCSAPFLDKPIVEALLGLDENKRRNRKWQDQYFQSHGIADNNLPKVILKLNRLSADEGMKKQFNGYEKLNLSPIKIWILKLFLSNIIRRIEFFFISHKITEFILRRLGYKRSDWLISILNVVAR